MHLSDSKLSIATVAKGCGISPRYLSFLLKLHGTPFSTLVWDKRLKMASGWLSQSKPSDISVSEIAYRVGFKSPAHFSRMFKRVYGMSPCEYRAANQQPEAAHVSRITSRTVRRPTQCKFPAVTTRKQEADRHGCKLKLESQQAGGCPVTGQRRLDARATPR